MAGGDKSGLHTIFSFFLGLMVTAFVGVGVYTFHPPSKEFERQTRELGRQEQAIRIGKGPNDLTPADREQLQRLAEQRNQLHDASEAGREAWGRSTSIILIAFATLVMAVSLIRADQLPVISNGLLLGGLFTMIYGVGWIVATDTSVARFGVMTVALGITLGLGYVRFVRQRAAKGVSREAASGDGLAEIRQRVAELEERMDGAASALGKRS